MDSEERRERVSGWVGADVGAAEGRRSGRSSRAEDGGRGASFKERGRGTG